MEQVLLPFCFCFWADGVWGIVLCSQQDCLRHLVAVMCESGQAASLVAFSFIGLHGEVEKTLSFKARNANPLAVPNYSKILFAWYTSRSDHRHGEFRNRLLDRMVPYTWLTGLN